MLDIQQKRKLRFFMYHKFTLGALFLLVLVFVHSTWVVYKKKTESESLMNISKQRVSTLRNRESDLNEKISRLDTEEGIEEEIRSKFTVTKDSENMVVIVPNTDEATATVQKSTSLWSKFISLFK